MTDETVARLREEEPPLNITARESICPRCRLVYTVAAGDWGVCPDCLAEAVSQN